MADLLRIIDILRQHSIISAIADFGTIELIPVLDASIIAFMELEFITNGIGNYSEPIQAIP